MPPRKTRLTREAWKDSLLETRVDIRATGASVIDYVSKASGLKPSVILSNSKRPDVLELRFMVSHLISLITGAGSWSVGRVVSKDASTVRHQICRSQEMLQGDKSYRERFQKWRKALESE